MRPNWHCNLRRASQAVIEIREHENSVTFQIKVQPRASRNAIIGEVGGALKLALTAPPVEGRANEACIELLADFLKVPRSSITIASGERGRLKLVQIAGINALRVRQHLAAIEEKK